MANKKKLDAEVDYSTNLHDYQFNTMKLDPELREELEAQGLAYRFINANQLKRNGYHRSYWKPYQRKNKTSDGVSSRIYGADPDGFVIRGDSILAVKPKAEADAYRSMLQRRNEVLARTASPANQLKKLSENVDSKTMKFHELGEDE